MSWLNVWDSLKNKTCRYLLQRYLGRFLDDQIRLEQLKIELYNGKAKIHNVILNNETLNELFEAQGWAVEVIGGHIGELTVQIPWNALMTNNSSIEVANLTIFLRPIQRRHTDGTSMLESMWSSVSSSMQLAEECIKQDLEDSDKTTPVPNQAIDGLEKFAETIDNVLNRITAKFTNTLIKFEHQMPDGKRSIGLTVKVQDFYYKNETGSEVKTANNFNANRANESSSGTEQQETENRHFVSTFAKHNIDFSGITISTEEFSNQHKSGKSIPIVDIRGQQKIIVRVKQSEEVSGPKILMDMELGAVYSLFTPRQVHLLLAFWSAFNDEDDNNKRLAQNFPQFENKKHFENSDMKKTHMSGVLNANSGAWGDHVESIPLTATTIKDDNLTRRTQFRYCDSLYSSVSSCSQSTMTSTARFQRKLANMESCGEIVKFNVRIGQISLNLLHEDVLFESFYDGFLNESSILNLLQISEQYFENLPEDHTTTTMPTTKALQEKCFISLRLTPIILDGIQQRNKQVLLFKLAATAAKFDLSEVLKGIQTPLILFDREENCADGYHKRPELAITLKSTSCNIESLSDTIVDIQLEKNTIELDISIYDRLSALLAPSQFATDADSVTISSPHANDNDKNSKSSTQLNIACNLLILNLRFPIVDARPIHEPHRVPWWKQNIREDFLQLKLTQFRLNFTLALIKMLMNEAEVLYCENATNTIQLLRSSLSKNETHTVLDSVLNCPKITIALQSQPKNIKDHADTQGYTVHKNLPFSSQHVCRQSETVHKRRDFAEAETILLPGDSEELKQFRDSTVKYSQLFVQITLPNVSMMLQSKQFYETVYNRINYNLFLWEPSSPLLNQCKQEMTSVYESLFNLDLSESIYKPSKTPAASVIEEENENECYSDSDDTSILKDNQNDNIQAEMGAGAGVCKSVYFSTHDNDGNEFCSVGSGKQLKSNNRNVIKTSACSVELLVPQGSLTVFVPVRDNEQHVLPEHDGRLDFRIEDFQLFSVAGFRENKNLNYVFLQTKSLEMFHCGLVPEYCSKNLDDIDDLMPDYMNATVYKLPAGLKKGDGCGSSKREMASVVIEIKKLPAQKIKRVRATAGIQTAALRHNSELASHTWLNQIIDFLDVQDVIVEGYQPYGVLTEMQLHLWDWAIDYRPKYFPFRAVLEIGTFTISSNIISSLNGCNLRFIVEEAVLSIGPYNQETSSQKNAISVLPSKVLVPVLDLGLLDISLRLSDKTTENCPKFDLRCSIHDANLRTCSDSGKALAQLIAYLASDGDFLTTEDYEEDSMPGSTFSDASSDILPNKSQSEILSVTEKQQERVEFMMAEAVQETVKATKNNNNKPSTQNNASSSVEIRQGIEVFYFPDENSKLKIPKPTTKTTTKSTKRNKHDEEMESNNEICDILNFESSVMTNTYRAATEICEDASPLVKQELGDIKATTEHHSEDEYCFLSEDEKIFKNRGASSPQVSNEPLRIVDNHFRLPMDKPDLLKSPDNFPMAETRYTICEMTFTWHLYGGSDFPENALNERQQIKSAQSRMSEAYKSGVAYSKSANNVKLVKDSKEKPNWKTAGGEQRDHQVLVEVHLSKVRFSHEIYPLTTSHASRQVFVVNEIEIRDRLQ